jgi:hypothetical protein
LASENAQRVQARKRHRKLMCWQCKLFVSLGIFSILRQFYFTASFHGVIFANSLSSFYLEKGGRRSQEE